MSSAVRTKVEFANTLRGFAALSVLISHYLGAFWGAREVVATLTNATVLPVNILTPLIVYQINRFPIFIWGPFGVALFFLISGFVIPFSLEKLNAKQFLINRFFRIYPTYMIGFSITLLAIFCSGLYYAHAFPYSLKLVFIHYFPGINDLLGANIDGIIWTLDIEIKFYLICALFAVLFKRGNSLVFLVPVCIGALALLALHDKIIHVNGLSATLSKFAAVGLFVSQYIVFMFIGTVFHFYYKQFIQAEKAIFLIIFLFAVFALIGKAGPSFNLVWSYGFALLLFSFAYAYQALFKGNMIFDFFADISYPLYVIHGVTGYALLRFLLGFGLSNWSALIVTTLSVISLATILHYLVELPSQKLAKYFINPSSKMNLELKNAYVARS